MTGDQYRLLGSVIKSKGISGNLVIRTKITTTGISEKQKFVMVKIDGLLVPFFIDSWKNISDKEIILKFRDTDTRESAEKFRDREIWLPRNEFKKTSLITTSPNISGYKVIDSKEGFVGITSGIVEIPENELLRVNRGDREVLIPIQEGIVIEINPDKQEIRVNLPDGLLDI